MNRRNTVLYFIDVLFFQRLYRARYEKEKDKVHSVYDTPEIRQVKATQEAISDVSKAWLMCSLSKFGQFIPLILLST